ncbi:MAG: outer membrane protein assembly factor BamA [Balneolales bacterium]
MNFIIKKTSWLALPFLILLTLASTNSQAQFIDTQDQGTERPAFRITNPMDVVPRQFVIRSLTIIGAEARTENFISTSSGLEEGESITIPGEEIPRAIKSLYQTGLFSDVKISRTRTDGSQVDLLIEVIEQPRLESFTISGIKRSQRNDLKEIINLATGFAVTESSKAQAIHTINRFYEDLGYRNTTVDVHVTNTDTLRNRITLDFEVDRGDRLQIGEISFEGNDSFSNKELRGSLDEIKKNTWWRFLTRQLYNDEDYETAKTNLLNFYRNHGFRDIRIIEDSVYVRDDKKSLGVFIKVNEGPQYHIRNLTWEGNSVYSDDQLSQALGFEKGDVFNEELYNQNLYNNKDENDVFSLYHNIGHLFLDIQPEIKIVGADSLDLIFNIAEDEVAKINEVTFSGNTKTHDDVVRRTLRNIPGATYSRSNIMRTIRELSTLGYFNPEGIQPDLVPDYENKIVDISYTLDESQSTDNFEFSGGFGGRQFGLILSARVNFNNFSAQNMFKGESWSPLPSGDGQKLSLGVQVTGRGYQNYNFSFQEPWFLGRPNSMGVNLSYSIYKGGQMQQFGGASSSASQEMFAAGISYGRRLSWPDDYFQQSTRLQYQYFDVQGYTGFMGGQANILSVTETLERNSLDNPISPNVGSRMTLSAEIAPPMPGFDQFYKTEFKFQQHNPLFGKLVTSYGLEHGYMGFFGSKSRSQFERYYLGGTQLQQRQTFTRDNIDMRGYPGGQQGSISPIRNNQEIGGTVYSKYFTEIRYPVISSDQVQLIPYLFAEAGNAYEGFGRFDPFDVKRSAGIGTRIFMPILGLIDLSYGYRFDGLPPLQNRDAVEAGEWQFLFNIGAPF